MMYSNGPMIPQSGMYQARLNATQQAAQDADMRLRQRQQQAGQNIDAGANVLGTLAGAIIGGLMTGGPGAIPGAALGSQIGGLVGKGGQMVADPNARTPQNAMALGQGAMRLASGGGLGGGQQAVQAPLPQAPNAQLQMPQMGQSMLRRGYM